MLPIEIIEDATRGFAGPFDWAMAPLFKSKGGKPTALRGLGGSAIIGGGKIVLQTASQPACALPDNVHIVETGLLESAIDATLGLGEGFQCPWIGIALSKVTPESHVEAMNINLQKGDVFTWHLASGKEKMRWRVSLVRDLAAKARDAGLANGKAVFDLLDHAIGVRVEKKADERLAKEIFNRVVRMLPDAIPASGRRCMRIALDRLMAKADPAE